MEAFDKAMEDTITAINTGCLRARDGGVLARAKGKAYVTNPKWRMHLDTIVDLLRAIRSRYEGARESGIIHGHEHRDGVEWYCIHDRQLAAWMDSTRSEILRVFATICDEAGITPPIFPRSRHRRR